MYGYPNYYPNYYQQTGAAPDVLAQLKAQQDNTNLIYVQGVEGAKSYMVAPGNEILLMDSEQSRFYIKSTGQNRMPMPLRVFEFKEITNAPQMPSEAAQSGSKDYVTREEFNKVVEKLNALTERKEEDDE